MTPNKGQYVKIIFRNSTHVEGFVDEWSDTKVILKSEDGGSYLIIMNLTADALAIKVNTGSAPAPFVPKEDLEKQFQEIYEQPSANNDLRIQSLAKLRAALNEQDKKIIAEKLVKHVPSQQQNPGVKYGNIFNKK